MSAALALLASLLAQSAPITVRGRVLDPKGRPAPGASLVFWRVEGGVAVAETRATSDAAGTFRIETANGPGEWSLGAMEIDHLSCRIRGIRSDWNGIELGPIKLQEDVTIRGRVTNESGQPVDRARIFVRPALDESGQWRECGTDGQGRYVLPMVLLGRVNVGVSAEGYADDIRPGFVVTKNSKDVDFTLARETSFSGKVVDDTGAQVEGAEVRVRRRDARASMWREPVTTDNAGRFVVSGFSGSPLEFEATASKVGFLPAQMEAKELFRGQPIVLRRGKVVIVRIDPPAPIVRLELQAMTKVGEGWKNESATVDPIDREGFSNGRVRATAPQGEFLRAFATLRGGALVASPHVELKKAGDPPEIVVPSSGPASAPAASFPTASKPAPEKTARLSGKLTYGVAPPGEEVPIAAFRAVNLDGGRGRRIDFVGMALAASDGSFAFDALPPGRIALVPKRPVTASSGAVRSFADEFPPFQETGWQKIATVGNDGAPVTFDLSIARPQERYVGGSVYVSDRPAPGCVVELIPKKGTAGAGSDTTDERGRYRIPLVKSGEYDLRMRHRDFTETRRIQTTDGQSRQVNFDFAPGDVEGSVADFQGKPISVRVLLQRERDSQRDPLWRWVSLETASGADGKFVFPILAPGRYRVLVHDPRHEVATVASEPFIAEAGARFSIPAFRVPKEVPLRVSAREKGGGPGTGRVWVTAADGTPRLAHLAQGWLFAQKEFLTIHGLPPGSYRVRMPGYFDEEVTLATGVPARVLFQRQRPESEPAPATDSAYHSPEAEEEKRWDWGGEVPSFYDQEDP